jgi:hypothetical protein
MPIDPPTYAWIHVVLSLLGIVSGLVVAGGLMAGVRFGGWIGLFLTTTVMTDLTGFGFPSREVHPSHIAAALSLLVLLVAVVALYGKRLDGPWRRAFAVSVVVALYMNVLVLVEQLFHKLRVLALLAPNPTAPAYLATHGLMLVLFIGLGRAAARGFGNTDGRRL